MKVGYQVLVDLQQQQAFKQWGYLQKQAEKWIYPIPVLEAFIATKTCISNNHSAAGYVGYWTWDKDITTEYAYSWNNYPSYCFMIGKVQQQWGNSASLSGYVAVCIFPISFTTTDYTAVATGVMSAADATFGKENYVNNILWDFTSESQVTFRLSHLDRPSLKYIAIGF